MNVSISTQRLNTLLTRLATPRSSDVRTSVDPCLRQELLNLLVATHDSMVSGSPVVVVTETQLCAFDN